MLPHRAPPSSPSPTARRDRLTLCSTDAELFEPFGSARSAPHGFLVGKPQTYDPLRRITCSAESCRPTPADRVAALAGDSTTHTDVGPTQSSDRKSVMKMTTAPVKTTPRPGPSLATTNGSS